MKTLLSLMMVFSLIAAPAYGQTLNETYDATKPLTDREQYEANNYVHQGKIQKVLDEECAKVGSQYKTDLGCMDQSGKPGQVFGGAMGGLIEEALPKLYAIMGTAAAAGVGGKIAMKAPKATGNTTTGATGNTTSGTPSTETKPTEPKKAEKNEKQDICIYIPMAGEVISAGMQAIGEKKIQSDVSTGGAIDQKESLYAVARTHDSRAKTATMQGGIYAATAGCYVAYLATGAVFNFSMALKIGASATMSAIFFKKAGKHKAYAKAVREVAKKIPGAGDCNPHTQTSCFCAEPTSRTGDPANWQKVCVPKELAADPHSPNPIPCATLVNGLPKLDAACQCKKSNSCFNSQFSALATQFDFGGVAMADPLKMLNNMNGNLDDTNVENFGNQLNARSKNLLGKNPISDIPSMAGLNSRQSEIAKELNKMGMPASTAAFTAAQDGAPVSGTADAPDVETDDAASTTTAIQGKKGTSYNYGGGSSSRRNQGGDAPEFVNPLAQKQKSESVQVETFAENAVKEAEITKDTSKGIFDIISHRYRNSAWNRFDVNAEPVPTKP